ncbi:MAG: hypothetical protein KAU20_00355 [Nanoarchaeota archaeon]|nr:hypothetical protein [Nanoarchaeota archaeon]
MERKILSGIIAVLVITGIIFISGCIGSSKGKVKVVEGVEFQIQNAEYEAGRIIVTLSTNVSVGNARIDIVDEAGQLLCTRYKDLIAGTTQIEMTDCKTKERITVSVSPPGGGIVMREFQFELPDVRLKDARFESGNIVVTLDADDATDNIRIEIIDETNQILCTKYKDLAKGVTKVELTDCEIKERITVSVSPPKAEMITRDFTLTLPEVRIRNVKHELGKLILSLDANMDMNDVRIYIFGKKGEVFCTKSEDLAKGLSECELSGCLVQKEITVSISPPTGKTTRRSFTLKLPLLELKEGFKYVYATAHCPGCSKRDSSIYVTKETSKYWEGIAGIKIDKKAYLMRWMIDKDDLDLSITMPLTEDALLGDVDYIDDVKQIGDLGEAGNSILPLWMVVSKELHSIDLDELITTYTTTLTTSQQESVTISTSDPALYNNYLAYILDIVVYQDGKQKDTVEFVISAAKPYLIIEMDVGEAQASFKRVEKKGFSLDDYTGYSIKEWTPPTPGKK